MRWRVSPVTLCFPSFSFLKVAIGFLVAWFRKPYCFLSMLDIISPLSEALFENIFFHLVGTLFVLLMVSFAMQKIIV